MPAHHIDLSIDRYHPAGVDPDRWEPIAPHVRAWVRAAAPGHYQRAVQLLSAAAALALWCVDNDIPVRGEAALRDTTVERFCVVAERDTRYSKTTRATIRSRLRCLARAQCVPGNAPALPALPRQRVRDPYGPAEVAALWGLTRAQRTPVRRRRLEALLACGLGAGCGPDDLRRLRPADVEARNGGVVLHLRGPRSRDVWVLDRYAPTLLHTARTCDEEYLIGGTKPDRRSVTTGLLNAIDGDAGGPRLEPGRLRSTWLLTHLAAGTRLDVLMDAAGLETATSLTDLRRHLDSPPADVAERALRAPTAEGTRGLPQHGRTDGHDGD